MTDGSATLETLSASARTRTGPALVSSLPMRTGGVDPLGLRQVNFNLMDQCLPGLNNAATRLRPYVVVTWAWWKALELAKAGTGTVELDRLKGFVDRVEVLFVASHLQAGEMDGLPGGQVLGRYRAGRGQYVCAGPVWEAFRKRRTNTSLMAPVAYGPSIKVGAGLGFLRQDEGGAMAPMAEVMPAVSALDTALGPASGHPALSSLTGADVSMADLKRLQACWRVAAPTAAERAVGRRRLYTDPIAAVRRPTIDLILSTLASTGPFGVDETRSQLARRGGAGDAYEAWRALQTRQLFRYGLEVLLVWVLREIGSQPASLAELGRRLTDLARGDARARFGDWLLSAPIEGLDPERDPTALIARIEGQDWSDPWPSDALDGVRTALRITRREGRDSPLFAGQADRLPLRRALRRADLMADLSLGEAMELVVSEWLIGQHIYWAVGRSGDDTQRLRLMLEEGGWTAATRNPGWPRPTPDRLATALSLMADTGLVRRVDDTRFAAA